MQTQTGRLLKSIHMSLEHLQYTVLNTQQNMGINTYIRILLLLLPILGNFYYKAISQACAAKIKSKINRVTGKTT